MLGIEINENIKKLYDIKVIHGIVVKIEPLRKTSTLILQYDKCQWLQSHPKTPQLEPRYVKWLTENVHTAILQP